MSHFGDEKWKEAVADYKAEKADLQKLRELANTLQDPDQKQAVEAFISEVAEEMDDNSDSNESHSERAYESQLERDHGYN